MFIGCVGGELERAEGLGEWPLAQIITVAIGALMVLGGLAMISRKPRR